MNITPVVHDEQYFERVDRDAMRFHRLALESWPENQGRAQGAARHCVVGTWGTVACPDLHSSIARFEDLAGAVAMFNRWVKQCMARGLKRAIDRRDQIHPGARIGDNVSLGAKVRLGDGSRVGEGSALSDHVEVGAGICVPPHSQLAARAQVHTSDLDGPIVVPMATHLGEGVRARGVCIARGDRVPPVRLSLLAGGDNATWVMGGVTPKDARPTTFDYILGYIEGMKKDAPAAAYALVGWLHGVLIEDRKHYGGRVLSALAEHPIHGPLVHSHLPGVLAVSVPSWTDPSLPACWL